MSKEIWSPEIRVMLQPIVAYRQLSQSSDSGGFWLLLRRPLFVAFVFAGFVSLTTAGRLTVPLVVGSTAIWSFAPFLQMILIASVVFIFARGQIHLPMAIDLFFMGFGPCLLWFLIAAGVCIFAPSKELTFWPMKMGWVMPASLLVVILWCGLANFAFLTGVLKMTFLKAGAVLLLCTGIFWGMLLSYFLQWK